MKYLLIIIILFLTIIFQSKAQNDYYDEEDLKKMNYTFKFQEEVHPRLELADLFPYIQEDDNFDTLFFPNPDTLVECFKGNYIRKIYKLKTANTFEWIFYKKDFCCVDDKKTFEFIQSAKNIRRKTSWKYCVPQNYILGEILNPNSLYEITGPKNENFSREDSKEFLNIINRSCSTFFSDSTDINKKDFYKTQLRINSNKEKYLIDFYWENGLLTITNLNKNQNHYFYCDFECNFKDIRNNTIVKSFNKDFQFNEKVFLYQSIRSRNSLLKYGKYKKNNYLGLPDILQKSNNEYLFNLSFYEDKKTKFSISDLKNKLKEVYDFKELIYQNDSTLVSDFSSESPSYRINLTIIFSKENFKCIVKSESDYAIVKTFIQDISNNILEVYYALSFFNDYYFNEFLNCNYTHGKYIISKANFNESMLETKCTNCSTLFNLSKKDLDSIVFSFQNDKILDVFGGSDCEFNPHDGILFYNQDKLVASIEICFSCGDIHFNNLKNNIKLNSGFVSFINSSNKFLRAGEERIKGSFESRYQKQLQELETEISALQEKLK